MPVGIGSVGWESVIRFGVGLAPKRCSHQAEFHHILSRRSPCGTDLGEMSEGRVERRLAAILAADVAGYSRLMGTDEEGTLAALRAVRRELADPKIAEHRGRIVKTTGDSLLVEFASVVDAVRCAVELQREMITRNAATPAERRIEFRWHQCRRHHHRGWRHLWRRRQHCRQARGAGRAGRDLPQCRGARAGARPPRHRLRRSRRAAGQEHHKTRAHLSCRSRHIVPRGATGRSSAAAPRQAVARGLAL